MGSKDSKRKVVRLSYHHQISESEAEGWDPLAETTPPSTAVAAGGGTEVRDDEPINVNTEDGEEESGERVIPKSGGKSQKVAGQLELRWRASLKAERSRPASSESDVLVNDRGRDVYQGKKTETRF
ncbi:hypothetical protein H6P81_000482 [Aristolochia fimbriata]|uniref:Uncharacterized protein n=1 Tax=Aristolochia fimbriata TaxID=158543 RepID=A0AAV7F5J5_ARIFI|nr:hypothetical protein H6P81_000482 [Aristolochia fimbriata]